MTAILGLLPHGSRWAQNSASAVPSHLWSAEALLPLPVRGRSCNLQRSQPRSQNGSTPTSPASLCSITLQMDFRLSMIASWSGFSHIGEASSIPILSPSASSVPSRRSRSRSPRQTVQTQQHATVNAAWRFTSALRGLWGGGSRCEDACVAGQRGQGRAADEGTETVFVSGQDSDGFQTGELAAGLDIPAEDTEHQLTKVLGYTEKRTVTWTGHAWKDTSDHVLCVCVFISIITKKLSEISLLSVWL